MKAKLQFNLPEEHGEFLTASNAQSISNVIWDLRGWLREQLKFAELTEETGKAYEKVQEKLLEFCDDNGVRNIIFE